MKRGEITCIICPYGCRIAIVEREGTQKLRGYGCLQGEKFAREELINPIRTLTTTLDLIKEGKYLGQLPVKSAEPIPRELIFPVMKALRGVTVTPPVQLRQAVVRNLLGRGISLIATMRIDEKL